jgi:hypothetical protein
MHKLPKPRKDFIPEKNPFYEGAIRGLTIVIPFWLVIAYLIWRW